MVAWSAVDHQALPANLSREVVLVSHTDLQRVNTCPAFNELYVTTAACIICLQPGHCAEASFAMVTLILYLLTDPEAASSECFFCFLHVSSF